MKTNKHHIIFFGTFFLTSIFLSSYFYTQALITNPENLVIHTRIVYYDGKFSSSYEKEDLKTAAYFLNKSSENIYIRVYEYDENYKEKKYEMLVAPFQNQFLKTEGPGTMFFTNANHTSTSTLVFTKYVNYRKYNPYQN